jgi:hypothetical protein
MPGFSPELLHGGAWEQSASRPKSKLKLCRYFRIGGHSAACEGIRLQEVGGEIRIKRVLMITRVSPQKVSQKG